MAGRPLTTVEKHLIRITGELPWEIDGELRRIRVVIKSSLIPGEQNVTFGDLINTKRA